MEGKVIKEKLHAAGVTQKKLAELLGITPQSVNAILSASDVRSGTIEKLSNALGMPVSHFYGGDVCIQTNEHGDNNFKNLVDASNYVAKIAKLEEQVKLLQALNEEKEKRIADKEKQLADKEMLIKVLMERK